MNSEEFKKVISLKTTISNIEKEIRTAENRKNDVWQKLNEVALSIIIKQGWYDCLIIKEDFYKRIKEAM